MRLVFLPALLPLLLLPPARAQGPVVYPRNHDSQAWKVIEAHLPDPHTATAETLEMEADILRARRFPEDAIDYYNYALARGGAPSHLLNKLGLAELEMHNSALAHAYFVRAVKVNRKDPEAWNNLGASEYLDGNRASAASDYKKAIKLNRREAVFHANLATVYFEAKDFGGARKEIAAALKLDPAIFDRREGQGGIAAHVLSAADRARMAFEMARMYARAGLEDSMLHSLAMASEDGMDIVPDMRKDPLLAKYVQDPRVITLIRTADAIRVSKSNGKTGPPPALASATTPQP